jgi:hypothetical protein
MIVDTWDGACRVRRDGVEDVQMDPWKNGWVDGWIGIGSGSGRDGDEAGEEREVTVVDKVIYMLGGCSGAEHM